MQTETRLIRILTACLQKALLKFEKEKKNITQITLKTKIDWSNW